MPELIEICQQVQCSISLRMKCEKITNGEQQMRRDLLRCLGQNANNMTLFDSSDVSENPLMPFDIPKPFTITFEFFIDPGLFFLEKCNLSAEAIILSCKNELKHHCGP